MEINEYQELALKTAGHDNGSRIMYTALGLAGESGEYADLIKKYLFHGHDSDIRTVKSELGDIGWYLAVACAAWNLTLEEVLEGNIEKLRKRYPEGFSEERSRNRPEEFSGKVIEVRRFETYTANE